MVGGANGSSVHTEFVHIEDVTTGCLRVMMDRVDVRDFGARGVCVFNNKNAFEAAGAVANWLAESDGQFPFGGRARSIESIVATSEIKNTSGGQITGFSWVGPEQGANSEDVRTLLAAGGAWVRDGPVPVRRARLMRYPLRFDLPR